MKQILTLYADEPITKVVFEKILHTFQYVCILFNSLTLEKKVLLKVILRKVRVSKIQIPFGSKDPKAKEILPLRVQIASGLTNVFVMNED